MEQYLHFYANCHELVNSSALFPAVLYIPYTFTLYMKFPTAQKAQSRDIEVVVTEIPVNGTSLIGQEPPVAKPWAHFVAGGYER